MTSSPMQVPRGNAEDDSGDATPRHRGGSWSARGVWAAGLAVALGAAIATAHGLYAVVLATGTLPFIAGLYPLITDGLALVAYAATARLTGSGRRYAWSIVVLAAGLSGLAQATHVAGGLDAATVPVWLRFVVGAWPALAAAIVAHLLYLLGSRHQHAASNDAAERREQQTPTAGIDRPPGDGVQLDQADSYRPLELGQPGVHDGPVPDGHAALPSTPSTSSNGGDPAHTVHAIESGQVPGQTSTRPRGTRPAKAARLSVHGGRSSGSHGGASRSDGARVAPRDRARAAALRHEDQAGELPTVRALMRLADVARGTAANALRDIRDDRETAGRPEDERLLHVVEAAYQAETPTETREDRSSSQ